MRVPRRVRGRLQPTKLLLASVVGVAVVVAGCSFGYEAEAPATLQSGPAIQIPPVASTPRVPPVTTPSEPTPGAPAAQPPPSGQTAPDREPTGSAPGTTLPRSTPVRLRIPSIGVDSALLDLGLQTDGTLEVPAEGLPAGWYTGAPTPGELGPAIIAGHVDWGGEPGVFFDLRELATGDAIAITRQDGTTARFRVTHVDQFDKTAFPTSAVYGDLDHAGLRLITCGGSLDREMRSYADNLVVFAELVGGDAAQAVSPS